MSEGSIKPFCWNVEKNNQLQTERGISFEAVLLAIAPKIAPQITP